LFSSALLDVFLINARFRYIFVHKPNTDQRVQDTYVYAQIITLGIIVSIFLELIINRGNCSSFEI